jgi:hypothetical protein
MIQEDHCVEASAHIASILRMPVRMTARESRIIRVWRHEMRGPRCAIWTFAFGALAFGSLAATPDSAGRWIVVTAPTFRDAIRPLETRRAAEEFAVTVVTTTNVLSILNSVEVMANSGHFEAELVAPTEAPWGQVAMRAVATDGKTQVMGVARIKVEKKSNFTAEAGK